MTDQEVLEIRQWAINAALEILTLDGVHDTTPNLVKVLSIANKLLSFLDERKTES